MAGETSNKGVRIEGEDKVERGVRITNGRTDSGDKVTYFRRERPQTDTKQSVKKK